MYTEAQLISFGNYLLEEYGVMVFSNDGKNTPLYQRMVHHADQCNWEGRWNAEQPAPEKAPRDWEINLPSAHQIGDRIFVKFGQNNPDIEGTVRGVHFFPGKVKYDVTIPVEMESTGDNTRIYNVDSDYVINEPPATPSQIPEKPKMGYSEFVKGLHPDDLITGLEY